jgi:hypothetical protein
VIAVAEELLPGREAPDGEVDPRWQAIIAVGDFIGSHPDEVWEFTAKWGKSGDPDLQAAIATCLLEHLLEHHFEQVFARVSALATTDRNFARTFLGCWKLGQSELSGNSGRFESLAAMCRARFPTDA